MKAFAMVRNIREKEYGKGIDIPVIQSSLTTCIFENGI
jgi:hypothetical protein